MLEGIKWSVIGSAGPREGTYEVIGASAWNSAEDSFEVWSECKYESSTLMEFGAKTNAKKVDLARIKDVNFVKCVMGRIHLPIHLNIVNEVILWMNGRVDWS